MLFHDNLILVTPLEYPTLSWSAWQMHRRVRETRKQVSGYGNLMLAGNMQYLHFTQCAERVRKRTHFARIGVRLFT